MFNSIFAETKTPAIFGRNFKPTTSHHFSKKGLSCNIFYKYPHSSKRKRSIITIVYFPTCPISIFILYLFFFRTVSLPFDLVFIRKRCSFPLNPGRNNVKVPIIKYTTTVAVARYPFGNIAYRKLTFRRPFCWLEASLEPLEGTMPQIQNYLENGRNAPLNFSQTRKNRIVP